ncbi:MAG: AI-2E family transporter, partial [Phycisphaerales bacterium]
LWVVQGQAVQVASDLPSYKANISKKMAALRRGPSNAISKATGAIAELGKEIVKPVDGEAVGPVGPQGEEPSAPKAAASEPEPTVVRVLETPTPPLEYVRTLLGPLLEPIATAAIVLVFATFILIRREDLRDRVVRLIGERSMHVTTAALDETSERVGRFLRLQLLVNLTAGVVIGAGLLVLGVPGAILWGALTVVLRFAPFIGVWVAGAFPLIVSIAVAPDWSQPLMTMGLIFVVELAVSQVLEPLVLSSGTGISSIAVLVAALFWGWLWGPVGLLLSTPLTVCVVVAGRHMPRVGFLRVLLGDEQPLSPEARLYQRLLAKDTTEAKKIVEEFGKERPGDRAEVYDKLVLPAMRMAKADRKRGDLDEAREAVVQAALVEVMGGMGGGATGAVSVGVGVKAENGRAEKAESALILCVPARDRYDEAAASGLARLLVETGSVAEAVSADRLSGEVNQLIGERGPAVVVISSVPPEAAVAARAMCKRLRAGFPGLPIVVALWDADLTHGSAREVIGESCTPYVVTTMDQALATVAGLVGGEARRESVADGNGTSPHSGQGFVPAIPVRS